MVKRFRSDVDVNYDPQSEAFGDYEYSMTEEELEYTCKDSGYLYAEKDEDDLIMDDILYQNASHRSNAVKSSRKSRTAKVSDDDLIAAVKSDNYLLINQAERQGQFLTKEYKKVKFNQSLLFQATTPEMVEYLVDLGVNPNVKNDEGQTLAHVVANNCKWSYPASVSNLAIMNKLIDLKVDLNVTDKEGKTPLYVMLSEPKILHAGYFNTAERMVRLGMDIDQPDNQGVTLYDYAVSRRKSNLVKFIKTLRQILPASQKIKSDPKDISLKLLNQQNEKD